ncbi:MAG: thiamine phosphate synthase [Candidatus Binataceae bacterium]
MRLPSHFYAIVDPAGGHEPAELARILLEAGARVLQLRLKNASSRDFLAAARAITPLCRACGALFIVNDRCDIALLAGADGVHLGQNDLPLDAGRRLLGPDKIIGVSTASVEMARAAEAGGADYIGFGPMYTGGLKNIKVGHGLQRLGDVRAAVKVPIVAIGGITEARVAEVLRAGADAAAIITDVVNAVDIGAKVRAILGANAG